MARTILDTQLHEISTGTIRLGTLVVTALDLALQALQSRDQALCSQLIESDRTIDDLRFEVEQLTFRVLTLQQPLAGHDLRFLSSIPSIIADLERIGDNAAGIAKLLLLMTPLRALGSDQVHIGPPPVADGDQKKLPNHAITEDSIVSKLLDLGQEACLLLRETMHAFEQSDAHAARKIWQEDDVVDVYYHLARYDLMTMLTSIHAIPALKQDSLILQRMMYWLWIAHKLERVGDHCTNICERIVFFLEGVMTIQPTQME
jgi:phosphate transport system protein